jgi:hypothetical protein
MKMNKLLTAALILIIVGAIFFVFFPNFFGGGQLNVTFYNADGQEVIVPYSFVPYGIVTAGGQDISYFTVTVNWFTNDPLANFIEWDVILTVSYLYIDSPTEPPKIVHEGLLWSGYCAESSWDNGAGVMTSQQFDIHAYASAVPDDTTFYLEFTGSYRFMSGNIERPPATLLYEGGFTPKITTCFNSGYEYEAWFGT